MRANRTFSPERRGTELLSSSLVHPLLSLTHWIFGSLMLPYKSSSRSAKYVRWCDSCSLATPMQRAELNTARQSSHKSPARDDGAGGPPIVISTEAKRSGEISSSDGTGGITVGDLSTQSIMGAVPVCPYTGMSLCSGWPRGEPFTVIAPNKDIQKKTGPGRSFLCLFIGVRSCSLL